MPFLSVLFTEPEEQATASKAGEPDYFADLNLDQVVADLTAGREAYDLAPFFHARLRSPDTIVYRHEVFRDLDDPDVARGVTEFAASMRDMRAQRTRASQLRHRYQQASWFLAAADTYRRTVAGLQHVLAETDPASQALRRLREYLADYVTAPSFARLTSDIEQVQSALDSVRYCMNIGGGKVTVTRYADEDDYGAEVLAAFEKFKQEEAKSYLVSYKNFVDMNHVEEAVLDRVALLFPEEFAALDAFCTQHRDHVDDAVTAFDREIQFYLAYREVTGRLQTAGLPFCHPQVSAASKEIAGREMFDLALADKLVEAHEPVITNDFGLTGAERVLVVSGPNQGGKTTFARAVGQLHHLAALGCPVPGTEARLFLCDELFTHFERGENLKDLSGKLHDDLDRVHAILQRATPRSLVIMNEVFTSTTLDDALLLGTRVLEQIIDRDLLCLCVTFVDELSRLGPATVSMTSTVVPDNPAERTFRIVRRRADGLSHALAIADKYGLTYDRLTRRISARTADERTAS